MRTTVCLVALVCAAAAAATWWGGVQQLRAEVLLHTRRYNPPLAGGDHAEGHEDRFPQPIFPDGTGQSRGGPGRRGGR
ncbi:MAG: hypothetical protein U1G05_09630 [Kiritimatiellia bacterium]